MKEPNEAPKLHPADPIGVGAIETKYFQIGGELVRKDLVAYGERRAAVELCLKLMRVMPAARHEVQVTIEELLTESWVDDKKPAEP